MFSNTIFLHLPPGELEGVILNYSLKTLRQNTLQNYMQFNILY